MVFDVYLNALVKHNGSDLYLTAGSPPAAKINGVMRHLSKREMTDEQVKAIAYEVMDAEQIKAFEKKPEMNLAWDNPEIGRFRVNIFRQRTHHAMVVRNIKTDIPQVADLGLPDTLKEVIMAKRGLVLFVGATGSGKSTSLAALIDHRNSNQGGHIITIEDPIEFVHPHKQSIVSQREVGVDTDNYEDALENTLRQAPDVILIGEIRTRETMEHAVAFAETGHLCLSTLHANSANQALDRIINFFPEERKQQLLLDLSLNIRAIISQRLVPTVDGKRTAAIEVMMGTPTIQELILKGDVHSIKEVMVRSAETGNQTFDMHLYQLFEEGVISAEEALKNADSINNMRLKMKLASDNDDGDEMPMPELVEVDCETPAVKPEGMFMRDGHVELEEM